jgi:hypothetical protein
MSSVSDRLQAGSYKTPSLRNSLDATGVLEGTDTRPATRRLMFFLQHWSRDWQARFSPRQNSLTAETFRATLMIAAISYGTGRDLRPTFRTLKFPVDDALYDELTATVGAYPGSRPRSPP